MSSDAIAIATHPSLSVSGLTIAQLQDIYTGKITNWLKVGGPDLPIVAYSRHPQEGGTVELFIKNVLHSQKLGNNVVLVPDTTAGLTKVASDPKRRAKR
ncbi:MAG: substrate-binding domain-containing protein [Prochloraceae cyanobacterium]|nr:substrate-binding domain-containing protein [Prochloraceae cyanobacterium]